MARKKKDTFETFYFTVDDWAREYRFGINRHRWEFDPNHYSERDEILVAGRTSHENEAEDHFRGGSHIAVLRPT